MKRFYSVTSNKLTTIERASAQGGKTMAKFENEGYCPDIWVPKNWNENTDSRIRVLWSIVGPSIVYEKEDEHHCAPNTKECDKIFGEDFIAVDLLYAIVKKNINADKILVHQLHNGARNTQKISDIQKVMAKVSNPELILCAGSNFAVVLADADYGMDVWVWDMKSCY